MIIFCCKKYEIRHTARFLDFRQKFANLNFCVLCTGDLCFVRECLLEKLCLRKTNYSLDGSDSNSGIFHVKVETISLSNSAWQHFWPEILAQSSLSRMEDYILKNKNMVLYNLKFLNGMAFFKKLSLLPKLLPTMKQFAHFLFHFIHRCG